MKYIHTDNPNSITLQQYLDDCFEQLMTIFTDLGYKTDVKDGKIYIKGRYLGKFNSHTKQGTLRFDQPVPKRDTTGFFCVNAKDYYKDFSWAASLPEYKSYIDLNLTDDVLLWREELVL